MSQKKTATDRLKNALNELDFAIEQWDSLTNKPLGEQVSNETDLEKKTKNLLEELREQLQEFETPPPPKDPKTQQDSSQSSSI